MKTQTNPNKGTPAKPPTYKICTTLLNELQPGQSFIVETQAKAVTHYATVAGVKVTTSQCLLIEDLSGQPAATRVVKATILGTGQPDKKKAWKSK